MARHFLQSAAARELSLREILVMSEQQAYDKFVEIRFNDNDGKPFCPHCQCKAVYTYKARRIFKCKDCQKQFSVTSGTLFAWRKAKFVDYLGIIFLFANNSKGTSALQLCRQLNLCHDTAFVMCHKLREAMAAEQMKGGQFSGTNDADGAYFGGHIKQANQKIHRKDRRLAINQNGKRRPVVVVRERRKGGRSRACAVPSEAAAVHFIKKNVEFGSIMQVDEAPSWHNLRSYYEVRKVNHSERFDINGVNTNLAESYFSRLRRAELGQHHHISGAYLDAYAMEQCWREDNRRLSNKNLYENLTSAALHQPPSALWKGYWQRGKKAKMLVAAQQAHTQRVQARQVQQPMIP